jgi:quercetin dioxygenase-like cupin family protein
MSASSIVRAALRHRRSLAIVSVILTVASLAGPQFAAVAAADTWWRPVTQQTAPAPDTPLTDTLVPFEATGLPAGAARGMPQRATLPPGFNLKHVHGGPSYVYVISGSLDIIDADGTKATYRAGDFFWEPVGRTHTAQTSEGAELFILRFVVPGAEGTVPVK